MTGPNSGPNQRALFTGISHQTRIKVLAHELCCLLTIIEKSNSKESEWLWTYLKNLGYITMKSEDMCHQVQYVHFSAEIFSHFQLDSTVECWSLWDLGILTRMWQITSFWVIFVANNVLIVSRTFLCTWLWVYWTFF